jgi:hypothetical protein
MTDAEDVLAQCLARLVAAIDARRRRQEATVADVQRLAVAVHDRSRRLVDLLQRWEALARQAADANAELQCDGATDTDARVAAFEQAAAKLATLGAEAEAIGDAAREEEFTDVARNADGLRAQLRSAQRKLDAVCERMRRGRVVH